MGRPRRGLLVLSTIVVMFCLPIVVGYRIGRVVVQVLRCRFFTMLGGVFTLLTTFSMVIRISVVLVMLRCRWLLNIVYVVVGVGRRIVRIATCRLRLRRG